MNLLLRLRANWLLIRHLTDGSLRFEGQCPCGCRKWQVHVPGVEGTGIVGLKKKTYDRILALQQ